MGGASSAAASAAAGSSAVAVLVLAAVGVELAGRPHHHQLLLVGLALLDGLDGQHHLLVAAVVAGVRVHRLRRRRHLLEFRTALFLGKSTAQTRSSTRFVQATTDTPKDKFTDHKCNLR